MVLKNPQTTTQYDTTQESTEKNTKVEAREYDRTKETRQASMRVDATVEGTQ